MATRKGKPAPKKKKPAEPGPPPAADSMDALPDVPEEEEHRQQHEAGSSDTQRLIELCHRLQARPDLDTARSVAELSGRLEDRFHSIREQAQKIARGQEAQAALAAIFPPQIEPEAGGQTPRVGYESGLVERFLGVPKAQPLSGGQTLADFFQRVSISVIRAQEDLDAESVRYAASVQGSQIPPMHFTIPNVHAEVKMGFNTESDSNILVKLFGKPEDTANYGESTVSFDVVASPPAPGAQPVPNLLVIGRERIQVLDQAKIGEDRRANAVALRSAGALPYLVIAPGVAAAADIEIYRVSLDRPEQIQTIAVGASPLRDALADLVSCPSVKTSP
jgi:hypothetical protein